MRKREEEEKERRGCSDGAQAIREIEVKYI